MTQFNWLEWAVIILGISVFILGSFLMQVLNETQRQRQSVDTHSHQIKRLTGLVRDLEVKNRELREQVSDNTDEADDASDDDSENTPQLLMTCLMRRRSPSLLVQQSKYLLICLPDHSFILAKLKVQTMSLRQACGLCAKDQLIYG